MLPLRPLPEFWVPGFLAKRKEKKELPEAPVYPRFHPLPTRPMFAAQPASTSTFTHPQDGARYGELTIEPENIQKP